MLDKIKTKYSKSQKYNKLAGEWIVTISDYSIRQEEFFNLILIRFIAQRNIHKINDYITPPAFRNDS